jgi:hypothetical protein
MPLTRDQILEAKDIATETVAVPEWGGEVQVRGMSGLERDQYEASLMQMRGNNPQWNFANARARLVARTAIDENGQRLFTDDDVRLLAKKSAVALQRVYDVATRLSGLSPQDMEDLTKNSANGQHEDSSID